MPLFMQYLQNPRMMLIGVEIQGNQVAAQVCLIKPNVELDTHQTLVANTGQTLTLALPQGYLQSVTYNARLDLVIDQPARIDHE